MRTVRHVTGAADRRDARQMRLKDFVAAARAAVPCQELGRELGECKRETAPGRLFGFKSCTNPGHEHSSWRGTVHYARCQRERSDLVRRKAHDTGHGLDATYLKKRYYFALYLFSLYA